MTGIRWVTMWRRNGDEHARMHDTFEVATSECVNWDRMFGVCVCRLLEVELDELPDANQTLDDQYQYSERMMLRWTAEHGRLADIVHGRELDKHDRDYHVRVKRNAEWKAHSTTELRRLLEMFKPPEYVLELRRDVPVHGVYETDKDGKYFQLPDRVWPFVVALKDGRLGTDRHEEASSANVNTWAETEGSAYAKMLAHLLDGRGFFPGT